MFDMCGGPPDPLDSDSFPTSIWILSVSVKPSNFNDLADSELLIDSDRQGMLLSKKDLSCKVFVTSPPT